MMPGNRFIFLSIIILVTTLPACAQVWQWSVPVRNAREGKGFSRAFLWIPPDCKKVRAVVIAQNNMEEESILESPVFREKMGALGFAGIWVSPFFDHLFRFDEGAGEVFNGMMDDLAAISGYGELRLAPVVCLGHSAAASWPYYFAAWNPHRTLAALSVSGQWPYFRSPVFAPDIWGNRNIDSVPCLETMGEYEAANTWSAEGLKERQEHPLMPLSMLACPAEGHFAATEKKIRYLAFYIKKAAQYRLVKDVTDSTAAILKPIDPLHTGWLADKWRRDEPPAASPAPVGKYTGDPAEAFWFFDEETVRATEKYESAYRHQSADLLGYVQDGKTVGQKNTHQQVDLKFQPMADGITFTLRGTFLDSVPGASPRPADWTQLPRGASLGHATGGGPIRIHRIWGPLHQLDATHFALQLEKGMAPDPHFYSLWFAATHPGDSRYKPAVQQAEMPVPVRNTEGEEQHIIFSKIRDQKAGVRSVPLVAHSDAGMPVSFYVREGPAVLKGDTLFLTPIPPRSRFPVKVTVVAWQYGRAVAPKLQTAEPVEQSFWIRR